MKTTLLSIMIFWAGTSCFATAQATDTIIDPELMNQDTWAEPYFPTAEEVLREPSSEAVQKEYVKNSDEYLDVLKKIPSSEPTTPRSWLEYKILHED